jgi:hypothetical protein
MTDLRKYISALEIFFLSKGQVNNKDCQQAGTELCQAQDKIFT